MSRFADPIGAARGKVADLGKDTDPFVAAYVIGALSAVTVIAGAAGHLVWLLRDRIQHSPR